METIGVLSAENKCLEYGDPGSNPGTNRMLNLMGVRGRFQLAATRLFFPKMWCFSKTIDAATNYGNKCLEETNQKRNIIHSIL